MGLDWTKPWMNMNWRPRLFAWVYPICQLTSTSLQWKGLLGTKVVWFTHFKFKSATIPTNTTQSCVYGPIICLWPLLLEVTFRATTMPKCTLENSKNDSLIVICKDCTTSIVYYVELLLGATVVVKIGSIHDASRPISHLLTVASSSLRHLQYCSRSTLSLTDHFKYLLSEMALPSSYIEEIAAWAADWLCHDITYIQVLFKRNFAEKECKNIKQSVDFKEL